MRVLHAPVLAALLLTACGSSNGGKTSGAGASGTGAATSATSSNAATSGAGGVGGAGGAGGAATTVSFDLGADLTAQAHYYDFPWPSDLRLTASGTPDMTGLPFPEVLETIPSLRQVAMEHPGFTTVPVAYFHFDGALKAQDATQVIPAAVTSPILLLDVDPTSPNRGALYPTVATTPPTDGWVPDDTLAAAPRPGFVLRPGFRHAFVVLKSLGDAAGHPLGVPAAITNLEAGKAPAGEKGAAALTLYKPLWDTLKMIHVDLADVAAATVFTPGDAVADTAALAVKVASTYTITVDDLAFNPANAAIQGRYCELLGKVTYPQFQQGTPPFDAEGLFQTGPDGLPVVQRMEDAPVCISIPLGEMPPNGFPLVNYFHGSGGLSTSLADRGTWVPTTDPTKCAPGVTLDGWNGTASCNMGDPMCVMGCNIPGQGPAYVLAPFGFAMAGSAMPLNPERFPGATETEYLNLNNLAAMRDTFRQGILEQHMFLDALLKLSIDPSVLAACPGVTLPAGATAFKFDGTNVFAQGQSMGGMYTNLITAVEPRLRAAVPTGAGGYWSHFILVTPLIPNSGGAVGTLLLGTHAPLTFMHPGLDLFEIAAEAIDPMVSMPRVARRPLPGYPSRPIYEPVGQGDSYFPEVTYDAMATAYGHKEAGTVIWPTMQQALALEGRGGIVPYSVVDDIASESGTKYTGMVVQYVGDGMYDPHSIYTQLDAVKYQYGCFLSTFLKTGKAVVPSPLPLGTPCPTM